MQQPISMRIIVSVFFLFTCFAFGQAITPNSSAGSENEVWKFTISVISQPFATETVLFSKEENNSRFEGKTILNAQGKEGVFLTSGVMDEFRIFEYSLKATYNGVITTILAFRDGEKMVVTYKDKTLIIPWDKNTILLDNNVSFMWQVFLKHLPYAETDDFIAVIPQLIVSSDVISYPLTIKRMSECDGQITLTFKLVNSTGVIKTDAQYRINLIQMGATKVEREE